MSDFKIKESRRSFVKKVGTGALLTSLPAQSVWGACNASGVSGGSRVVDVTCDSPPTISIGGWSPGQWQKYVEDFASVSGGNATYSSNSLCIVKMFEDFPTPTGGCSQYEYLEYYHNEVKSLLNINIELGGGHLFDSFSFNPYDAFTGANHSESRKDWSACYMNLLLGFWTWDTNEFSDPIDVLNGLWVYFSVTDGGQDSTGKYVGSPGSIVSFAIPKYTESKVSVNDVKNELGEPMLTCS